MSLRSKVSILVAATAVLASSLSASIIDTRPPSSQLNYFISTGSDTAGGTFTADDLNLASFSLSIGLTQSGGVFRAIVLGTAAGTPTGAPLWESPDIVVPASLTEFVFVPNLSITPGQQYYIGIDTGLRTTSVGGSLTLGWRNDNPLSGGSWFEDLNGGGFSQFSSSDISSRIVMTSAAVPEPSTIGLLGLGLVALAFRRRRA